MWQKGQRDLTENYSKMMLCLLTLLYNLCRFQRSKETFQHILIFAFLPSLSQNYNLKTIYNQRASTKWASLEIWLRVGENIICLSPYIFNSSHNFEVIEKFIK